MYPFLNSFVDKKDIIEINMSTNLKPVRNIEILIQITA